MKEVKAYQCESCKQIYLKASKIKKCMRCGIEICYECELNDNYCDDCSDILNDEEEERLLR